MITRNCLRCGKTIQTTAVRIADNRGKYCSKSCTAKSCKNFQGHSHSQETKEKIRAIHKGKHYSPKTEFKKGQMSNEKHPMWKGDKVSRVPLHSWVARNLGRPKKCEFCGTTDNVRYEWANKSRKYHRDLTDWIRLYVKCHRNYDENSKKSWITRRKNGTEKWYSNLSNH